MVIFPKIICYGDLLKSPRRGDSDTFKFSKSIRYLHLRNHKGMQLKLGINAKDISLYINCVFYSGRIRTLVAMATYNVQKLVMGKVKIDNFTVSKGIFGIYFYRSVN